MFSSIAGVGLSRLPPIFVAHRLINKLKFSALNIAFWSSKVPMAWICERRRPRNEGYENMGEIPESIDRDNCARLSIRACLDLIPSPSGSMKLAKSSGVAAFIEACLLVIFTNHHGQGGSGFKSRFLLLSLKILSLNSQYVTQMSADCD